jgi:lipoprotein NlpI
MRRASLALFFVFSLTAIADAADAPRELVARAGRELEARKFEEAVKSATQAIESDPKFVDAYDLRGSANFMLGRIKESAADFDKVIELRPDSFPGHWRRGITLYYAGRYEDGRKQFEGYEKVDTNDVENAVWHYLCNARVVGRDKARAGILKIGKDKRVPMMTVYELFAGNVKPDDVLKAVDEDKPGDDERKKRLFYAHLYLGLWYESEGDNKKAREHLIKAADDYRISHYMGDVARVHRDLLKK